MPGGAVAFEDVSYRALGGQQILCGITLAISPGERVALLGRSGSGKTTLLRTINGMVAVSSGRVLVDGRDTREWQPLALRRHCGYVIQEGALFPNMNVGRNTALLLEAQGVEAATRRTRVGELLTSVGLDPSVAERMPRQLSGGQRQRVGVARALAADAPLLLMDEPFGALDPLTRREMQSMVRALLDRIGKTLVLVTHDLDEAMRLATRIVLLEGGRVAADLSRDQFAKSEIVAVRAYRDAFRSPLEEA